MKKSIFRFVSAFRLVARKPLSSGLPWRLAGSALPRAPKEEPMDLRRPIRSSMIRTRR
jgi:hypothetical protein